MCSSDLRVNQQHADVGLQQVSNIISLLSGVVLSINDLYSNAHFLSLSLYTLSQIYEEGVVLGGYREANGQRRIAGKDATLTGRRF